MTTTAPHLRFREARERRGLSEGDVGTLSGFGTSNIWDIETHADELTCCYSPREVKQLCEVLVIRPIELFADSISEPAVSADELVRLIDAECRSRGVTLEQFEDIVGWRLSACMTPPAKLLEDMTVDGLQWLCRELRIDWRRVLLGL